MNVFSWAPMGAAGLHIFEEFVYPGGFAEWDRHYRPGFRASITPRFHLIINGLLLLLCYDVGAMGGTPIGIAGWLAVMALLFGNAVWHVVGTVRTRRYSPGVITGVLLYVPLAIYGYIHLLRSGQVSVATAIVAFAIGSSYPLIGTAIHRWRTKGSEGRWRVVP